MSSFPDISVVRQVVIDAANRTGLSTFGFHVSEAKGDGSVVTEFDHKMQELILTQLSRTWPEYSFLGEEMEHDEQDKQPPRAEPRVAAGASRAHQHLAAQCPEGP